jgi:hypothetical protein
LGNAYYFNGQLEKAEKWYGELLRCLQTLEQNTTIAQSLRASGNNEKNQILTQLSKIASDDSRVESFLKDKNYLEDIKANSGRYTIEDGYKFKIF